MLTQINLVNFKSFKEVEINFGHIVVIVGTNASGKSNLRDALRFLHGIGLGYTLVEILGKKTNPDGILQWKGIRGGIREAGFQGQSVFKIKCVIRKAYSPKGIYSEYHYQVIIELSNKYQEPKIIGESLDIETRAEKTSLSTREPIWSSSLKGAFITQDKTDFIRIAYPRGGEYDAKGKISDFYSDRPVLSQLCKREKEPEKAQHACTEVLKALEHIRFLDLDPDTVRQPSIPGAKILGDRGENFSSVLFSICQDKNLKLTLLDWLDALTPMDVIDFKFETDHSGELLVYFIESNGHTISALSASDGTLRFLALVTALLNPDSGQIYFFEEFDNGIHPTRLRLLLQLIQQVCQQQQIQVICTTHNPVMLTFLNKEVGNDALLIYRNEDTPDSRVKRISTLPDIEEVLKSQNLARLHASGWLENVALFSEADTDITAEEKQQ
ncbi:AAA family ATPase [Candidatus Venteria ishoeyi]|uniref:Chromosome partition protein Smc n=1 Tax=Candidatus Venteria ishoeyi TaxID=1899563 RepID=A0A1H6FE10_9GAMM|nr:ATP-binding protein [Candidatus Venteria ishoeyi]MDM8545842.1 AAA family ATPase [Candidatus Venteria ishoeyi]SEH08302.1 Chromosome partition protein Smc [Candidatus Venteria ishoeyi]